MRIKLYHFTSRHHIRGCIKEGLKFGHIPVSIDPPKIIPGYQWLTKNKSFEQEWEKYSSLKYRRNYYQITIIIPKKYQKNLYKWLFFCKNTTNPEIINASKTLNMFGDPHKWYIYRGIVSPDWFVKVNINPEYTKSGRGLRIW
uniref:DUF4433 domain-containing protein n=1 Tax=viral metagenome TaxID=1070528 RepID=A0A6M3LCZ7_9ZZZZ